MKYQTRDFGEVELEEEKTLQFVQPMFGFEDYTKFTLLFDQEIGPHITWLQSLEEPSLCFLLMDPDAVRGDYAPELPENIEQLLGPGQYACWVVAVLREPVDASTVNLKSPVLINMETRQGVQVILDQSYPVRYPVGGEAKGKSC